MGGPTCEVLLTNDDRVTIDRIDAFLALCTDRIDRTRKGRTWDIWVRARPVHVNVDQAIVTLSAGCHDAEDWIVIRELADGIVKTVGGISSEPEK